MTAAGAPMALDLLPRTATVEHGRLVVGGCDVAGLAETYGTPLYVYDEADLRARCREYRDAFGDGAAYAAKAFLCLAMARLVAEEGLALDVATGGELHVALAAGFPPERIVFHGNNKTTDELRTALRAGVGRIVADSSDELDRIEALVAEGASAPRVLVRVTPGVEAHTHDHIATGADDSKFGFSLATGAADEAALRVAKSDAMQLAGLHCHIGSQIFVLESYATALGVVVALAVRVTEATGTVVPEINVGGGLGVAYTADDGPSPSIGAHATALHAALDRRVRTVRALAGSAAGGRAGPLDRRARRPHPLHGGHHQGDRGPAHVRRGRRRDE